MIILNNLREENATMKTSDRVNVELARYLDQKFESVSIYTGAGSMSSPGPDTVWFDLEPCNEGWWVIRWLQAFLQHFPNIGRLEPYTYNRDLPMVMLGWSFTLPPSRVEHLKVFVRLKEAQAALRKLPDTREVPDTEGASLPF